MLVYELLSPVYFRPLPELKVWTPRPWNLEQRQRPRTGVSAPHEFHWLRSGGSSRKDGGALGLGSSSGNCCSASLLRSS